MTQTAVEWFNQQLVDRQNGKGDSRSWNEILEQAKAMERTQMIDFTKTMPAYIEISQEGRAYVKYDAEQHYNETYNK
jgi:SOS-response transcriptional repressor LexA